MPSSNTYYVAIDPGKTGALAIDRGPEHGGVCAYKCPDPWPAVLELCRQIAGDAHTAGAEVQAAIESVHAFPKDAKKGIFTFGFGYGCWRMAMLACGISQRTVEPREWQKAMGPLPRGMKAPEKKARKMKIREVVSARFPDAKVFDYSADAFGILIWLEEQSRTPSPSERTHQADPVQPF